MLLQYARRHTHTHTHARDTAAALAFFRSMHTIRVARMQRLHGAAASSGLPESAGPRVYATRDDTHFPNFGLAYRAMWPSFPPNRSVRFVQTLSAERSSYRREPFFSLSFSFSVPSFELLQSIPMFLIGVCEYPTFRVQDSFGSRKNL